MFVFSSCSPRKDRFLNRNYNAMVTYYNTLFNGKQALYEEIKTKEEGFQYNYYKTLPIDPIYFPSLNKKEIEIVKEKPTKPAFNPFDIINGVGNSTNSNSNNNNSSAASVLNSSSGFTKAEEKARKAIEEHEMYIRHKYKQKIKTFKGKRKLKKVRWEERNRITDNAYFVLGQSLFFQEKYLEAYEAFDIISVYIKDENYTFPATIWKSKCLALMENIPEAITTLDLIPKETKEDLKKLKKRDLHQIYSTYAQLFYSNKEYDKAIRSLDIASNYATKKDVKKYSFIKAQYHLENGDSLKAKNIFTEILNSSYSKEMKLFSEFYLYPISGPKSKEREFYLSDLKSKAEKSKYKELKGEILYQIGNIYKEAEDTVNALKFFKKSTQSDPKFDQTSALAFTKTGNIWFNKQEFEMAYIAYDSAKVYSNVRYPLPPEVDKRYTYLKTLVENIKLIKEKDSILELAGMKPEAQKLFFENYILKLKEEDQKKKEAKEREERRLMLLESKSSKRNDSRIWTFYNPVAMRQGKEEFKQRFGDRGLSDNWRFESRSRNSIQDNKGTSNVNEEKEEDKYDLSNYLSKIPKTKQEIEQVKNERDLVWFKIGEEYFLEFNQTTKSTKTLENLLLEEPNTSTKFKTHYILYKAYSSIGNESKASYHFESSKKLDLAKIQKQEQKAKTLKEYEKLYSIYKSGQYDKLILETKNFENKYLQSDVYPKVKLLEGLSFLKKKELQKAKKTFQYISQKYRGSRESLKAIQLSNQITDFINTKKEEDVQKKE